MNKQDTIIKKGELFMFSEGNYSDYQINAVCRAKKNIDIEAAKQEYFELYPKQEEDYAFEPYRFIKWIIVDKDLAEEIIQYKEWYLGEYSADFSLEDKGLNKED